MAAVAEALKALADTEGKLLVAKAKLEEIERMKAMEPQIRKEIAALTQKVEKCKAEAEEAKHNETFYAKSGEEEEAAKQAVAKAEAAAPKRPSDVEAIRKAKEELTKSKQEIAADARAKKMKALNKKLKQIEDLKAKGGALDKDAQAKVDSEPKLRKAVAALERGEDPVESDNEEAAAAAPVLEAAPAEPAQTTQQTVKQLPTEPAENEKAQKAIRKKLAQIEALKKKPRDSLDADAQAKILSKDQLEEELAALERGDAELVICEKTEAEVHSEERMDLDRRLKAATKKCDAVTKLKAAQKEGKTLTEDEQAKVDSAKDLNKAKLDLQRQLQELDKKERDRVAERLGWEKEKEAKKKTNGKK